MLLDGLAVHETKAPQPIPSRELPSSREGTFIDVYCCPAGPCRFMMWEGSAAPEEFELGLFGGAISFGFLMGLD